MADETNTRSWNSCVTLRANFLSMHFSNFVPLSINSSKPGSLQAIFCSSRFQNWVFKHWMNPLLSVSSFASKVSFTKKDYTQIRFKKVENSFISVFVSTFFLQCPKLKDLFTVTNFGLDNQRVSTSKMQKVATRFLYSQRNKFKFK